jgi:LuxR family transcriptional regulator, maltose regulon positive regulatory protein
VGTVIAAIERRPSLLVRERLLETVRSRFEHRLVAIVAGAGFGKSTLIRQAIEQNAEEPRGIDAWIECTADDVHVASFTARLGALLEVDGALPTDPVMAARAVADAISLRSPLDVCLIVEDAHLVRNTLAWEVIRQVHDRLPPNGHLLIATRTDPDLPFARLAAHGEAILIGEEELAFNRDESIEFGRLRGADLSAQPIAWPALAELAVRGASPRLQRSYLVEEVVRELSSDVRLLLGSVIVAEGADDDLARALLRRPVNVADELRSVPLVRVDDDGWAQPHDLWRQALPDLLTTEELRCAQDLAAAELARRGRAAQALRLHTASGNWSAAGGVALRALSIQPPAVDSSLMALLLDRVPDADRSHPGWQLGSALLTYERSLPAARDVLERLAASLERHGEAAPAHGHTLTVVESDDAFVSVLFHLGTIGRRTADEALLRSVADRLAPLAHQRHQRAIAVLATVQCFLAQIHGTCADGLDAVSDIDHASLSAEQSAHVLLMAGNLHLLDDRPERAAALYREASNKTSNAVRLLADELYATATWASGATDDALEIERRCLETAERLGLTSRAAQFRAMLSAMLAMLGRIEEASDVLAALPVELGSRSADSETKTLTLLALALIALSREEEQQAIGFLQRIPPLDGALQRASFFAVSSIAALLPERSVGWDEMPARLIRRCAQWGHSVRHRSGSDHEEVARLADWESPQWKALVPSALRPRAAREQIDEHVTLRLSLLGPIVVEPLAEAAPWRRSRVREVVAAIALRGPCSREQIAELVWPEQPDGVANRNLRVHLSYLADAVENDRSRGGAVSLLAFGGVGLALASHGVWLVLVAFDDARRRARAAEQDNDPAGALSALSDAMTLWRGDVAADLTAEWLEDERRIRRAQFLDVVARCGELALGQGQIDQALACADHAFRVDGLTERIARLRAAVLLAAGDRRSAAEAIRSGLEWCDEMGVEPEAETTVLATRLGVE